MSKESATVARFINPPNKLKQKVGTGGIDERLIEKSQKFIENTNIDFKPIALNFLKEFGEAIKNAKKSKTKAAKEKIVAPVMQLKANGGMFQYRLVSDVADIALQFLEGIETLNKDAFEVIDAHEKTLEIILSHKLQGDGGSEGYALVKELDKACRRYFKKHQKKPAKKPGKTPKKG